MITYRGERFAGYNKPKRTPSHRRKSHAVLAKQGNRVRLIRFGQQGVTGAGKRPTTAKQKARAGADIIVTGTAIEKEKDVEKALKEIVHELNNEEV